MVLDDLADRLPEQYDMEDIRGRVDEVTPYVMVAIQVSCAATVLYHDCCVSSSAPNSCQGWCSSLVLRTGRICPCMNIAEQNRTFPAQQQPQYVTACQGGTTRHRCYGVRSRCLHHSLMPDLRVTPSAGV